MVGWSYARVGELDATVKANLSWLAGYRHPRFGDPVLTQRLRGALETPVSVVDAIAEVGDWIRVAPTLFHLIWSGAIEVDLETGLLGQSSRVIWRNADVGLAAG